MEIFLQVTSSNESFLQITTKLLQITTAFLLQITTKFLQIAAGIANYDKIEYPLLNRRVIAFLLIPSTLTQILV